MRITLLVLLLIGLLLCMNVALGSMVDVSVSLAGGNPVPGAAVYLDDEFVGSRRGEDDSEFVDMCLLPANVATVAIGSHIRRARAIPMRGIPFTTPISSARTEFIRPRQ